MKNIIFALLWCYAIQAQTFDFNCEVDYTLPSDYSHITLETPAWEYLRKFSDDLIRTTGEDFSSRLNVEIERTITDGNDYYEIHGAYDTVILMRYSNGNQYAQANGVGDQTYLIINSRLWPTLNRIQRLWLMYHELGHEVLNLGHTFFTTTIEEVDGSLQAVPDRDIFIMDSGNLQFIVNTDIEYFINAKDLMFKRINTVPLN